MNCDELMERGRDFLGAGRLRPAQEHRRDEIVLGIGAAIIVAIVTAVLGFVYLQPPGYSSYRAELSNSSGVRAGDQVRVAGITVGKVDDVRLAGDHVAMKFSVRRDIR
ncbi:MlaD family protein, partial [Mycobacterium kansasii]